VIRDILHRLSDRFPSHVLVWPVLVQGQGSAEQVAAAVRGFSELQPGGPVPRPDLVIVARGGGSVEDLWGFNEEVVVRAIADCTIPIISAVGHETDTTLADYAADARAPTPTAAAEMAVPVRAELLAAVEDLALRQKRAAPRPIALGRERLEARVQRLPRPEALLQPQAQRLDDLSERLRRGLSDRAAQARALLMADKARLSAPLLRSRLEQARNRLVAGRLVRWNGCICRSIPRHRWAAVSCWSLAIAANCSAAARLPRHNRCWPSNSPMGCCRPCQRAARPPLNQHRNRRNRVRRLHKHDKMICSVRRDLLWSPHVNVLWR
jgi:exonuclease VII large subunit